MPVIRGVIEGVYNREVKTKRGPAQATSFKVDGVYYSGGFKKWTAEKGDEVEITYAVNAQGFNDVTKMDVVTSGGLQNAKTSPAADKKYTPKNNYQDRTFPVGPLDPARAINRQNALGNATKLYVETLHENVSISDYHVVADEIIEIARRFEAYTTGDIDAAMAKELAEQD